MSDAFEEFSVPLGDGPDTVASDEPLTLPAEVQAEIRAQLEEIRAARAAALIDADRYVIWR